MRFIILVFIKFLLTLFSLYIPNGIIGKSDLMYEIKLPKWFEYIVIGTPFDAPINVALMPLLIAVQTRLILYILYVFVFNEAVLFNVGARIVKFFFFIEMIAVVVYMVKYRLKVYTNPYFIDKKYKP